MTTIRAHADHTREGTNRWTTEQAAAICWPMNVEETAP